MALSQLVSNDDSITNLDELSSIRSFQDLSRTIKQREALALRMEEKVMDVLTEGGNVDQLSILENAIKREARKSLSLCVGLSSNAWQAFGVSEKQHEQAGEKAKSLMRDFKGLAREVREERTKKEKERQFNLLEFNAAWLIAPVAAHTLMDIFFSNKWASKGATLIVIGAEATYIVYKMSPEKWAAAKQEVMKTNPRKIAQTMLSKEYFTNRIAGLKRSFKKRAEVAGVWIKATAPMRKISERKKVADKKNEPL